MSGSSTGLALACDKCGKEYTHPKRLANHALHCTGKAIQTRGRIDRLAHRPAAKAPAPKAVRVQRAKSKRVRLPARKAERAAPQPKPTEGRAELVGARDTMLAELRSKRDLIDAAIRGLEALA